MARIAAWMAFAVVAAAVVGCGPAKELPEVPKGTDSGEKTEQIPTVSDPKAKEYVAKAVAAFTAGKPELVAKGKASRLVLKGTMLYPVDNQQVQVVTTRTIAAVWPDRFYGLNEHTVQGNRSTVTAWLHRPNLTILSGTQAHDPDRRTEAERNLAADVTGQHWMALLAPLTDPKAVLFDFQSTSVPSLQTGQPQEVRRMKLAYGDLPQFQLTFDAKTDLLFQVDYTVKQGVRRRVQWLAFKHDAGPHGLLLPSRTEVRHDAVTVEQWEADKWEFPDKIDDAEFSPPPPKLDPKDPKDPKGDSPPKK